MERFDLPMYFIVGLRPVKFVRTETGDLIVLKLNFQTGEFEPGMEHYSRCLHDMGGDVREVSEADFIQHVERVRGRYIREREEGAVFPLYDLANDMEETADKEQRQLTPWEDAFVTRLRQETHQMFEAELQKRKQKPPSTMENSE